MQHVHTSTAMAVLAEPPALPPASGRRPLDAEFCLDSQVPMRGAPLGEPPNHASLCQRYARPARLRQWFNAVFLVGAGSIQPDSVQL